MSVYASLIYFIRVKMSKSLNLLIKNIEHYALGIPITTVLKNAGIPHSTVSRIINQQTNPTLETIDKIANSLNVNAADLLSDHKDSKIPTDLLRMLENRDPILYETIRNLLKTIDQTDQKKKKGAS